MILVLVPSLEMGGAEVQALRNAHALLLAGEQVTLVSIFQSSDSPLSAYLDELIELGLRYACLMKRTAPTSPQGVIRSGRTLLGGILSLRRHLRASTVTHLYSRLWFASLVGWLTSLTLWKKPFLIFNEESNLLRNQSSFKALIRVFLLKKADLWIAPCEGLFRQALSLGAPEHSGTVVPNITFIPAETEALPAGAGRIRIGYLGRLEPEKGVDRLLEVAKALRASNVSFELLIGGAGSQREKVAGDILNYELGSSVRLLGMVTNVSDFYRTIDVLILTSRYEGFASVIIEANAFGRPVVAMDVEFGPADIIAQGVTGFLVPDGDIDAMVSAITKIARDGALSMQAQCRLIAERDYSIASQAVRWSRLL